MIADQSFDPASGNKLLLVLPELNLATDECIALTAYHVSDVITNEVPTYLTVQGLS